MKRAEVWILESMAIFLGLSGFLSACVPARNENTLQPTLVPTIALSPLHRAAPFFKQTLSPILTAVIGKVPITAPTIIQSKRPPFLRLPQHDENQPAPYDPSRPVTSTSTPQPLPTGTSSSTPQPLPTGTSSSTPTNTPLPAKPKSTLAPKVIISDQSIQNGMVIADQVVSNGPGWIVIYTVTGGQPDSAVGSARVHDGANLAVMIRVDATKATSTLHAQLHKDAGEVGVFEYPGADTPIVIGLRFISAKFKIIAGK